MSNISPTRSSSPSGDAQRNGGAEVDQEGLDAGLRQVLAEMVLPEIRRDRIRKGDEGRVQRCRLMAHKA